MDRLLTIAFSLLVGAAVGGLAANWDRSSIAQQPPAQDDRPDPTFEMVENGWATLKIPGYRQSWGRPTSVTKMVIYEPGRYLPGEKDYAVFWTVGQSEHREDFDTREAAMELVQFIIRNSKRSLDE